MNIILITSVYFLILLFEYRTFRKKLSYKEKVLYIIFSVIAVASSVPASIGMDFDTVGSSLSGMISLFMH